MTLVVAIIGAVTGVASLAWNVMSFRRQGPVIKVQATCIGRGPAMKITGTVRNTGRLDAALGPARFEWDAPLRGVAAWTGLTSPPAITAMIPQANITNLLFGDPLPAASGREFVISDVGQIDPGLGVALHDQRRVKLIITTASKAVRKPVKYA